MFNGARYCVKCGKTLRFKMRECPWCGTKVKNPDKTNRKYFAWSMFPVFGWITGLILFFALQNEYPKKADSAAKGVAAGVVATMVAAMIAVLLFVK